MFESATNTYRLVKINTSYTNKFISNTIEKLNIINEGNLKKYDKSKEFEKLIKHENMIRRHPSFLKIISENNNIIKCRWINLTHSPDDIKINQQNITKTKVSSYIKDGKEYQQYLLNASCEIELTKEEYKEMIQDISNNPDEINKLGGHANIKKIQEKLENEWENKPSYEYIKYLQTTVISNYEKYENKNIIDDELNKPEEE